MARATLTRTKFSGEAGDRSDALSEPRALIAHPLYLARVDEPQLTLGRWELPAAQHPHAAEFQKFLRSRKAFVVGGCQFIVEMGLVADWYRDDEVRQEAVDLLRIRRVSALLQSLADKENSDDALFGKKAISDFLATLPRVKRDREETRRWKQPSNRELYSAHQLRLRKAIEFITLTEVVVRRRLRAGKSQARFRDFTGLSGNDENNALFVWDHFWIEPVIYVVDPLPRKRDIAKMLSDERITAPFEQRAGVSRGALPWVLLGVPVKLDMARAAAEACNRYYGKNAEQTVAVTVSPAEYRQSLSLLYKERDFADYVRDIPPIWSLGPANAAS